MSSFTKVSRIVASVVVIAALAWNAPAGAGGEMGREAMKGRVMAKSKYAFDETVSKVKQAIEGQQMMVVFTADHQAMLQMVGLKTKGTLGIEFFHPRYGKVIAENDHAAGIEIPFRLMVMEGDMGTMISYYKPSYVLAKYPKLQALGQELDGVVKKIEQAVTE
ncbi:MAG: DUF302 domain-containing protein [Acidobacteria bacterium]|nr:DUF302 domain-containing protein [Acidobacteriota bacterium]